MAGQKLKAENGMATCYTDCCIVILGQFLFVLCTMCHYHVSLLYMPSFIYIGFARLWNRFDMVEKYRWMDRIHHYNYTRCVYQFQHMYAYIVNGHVRGRM